MYVKQVVLVPLKVETSFYLFYVPTLFERLGYKKTKNQLRAMAFNLVNIEEKRFFDDKKMIDVIKNLREKVVLLALDKGNGVGLLDNVDYTSSLEHIFEDRTKFRILKEDPTNTRFTSIQNFLRTLKKRGEINDE